MFIRQRIRKGLVLQGNVQHLDSMWWNPLEPEDRKRAAVELRPRLAAADSTWQPAGVWPNRAQTGDQVPDCADLHQIAFSSERAALAFLGRLRLQIPFLIALAGRPGASANGAEEIGSRRLWSRRYALPPAWRCGGAEFRKNFTAYRKWRSGPGAEPFDADFIGPATIEVRCLDAQLHLDNSFSHAALLTALALYAQSPAAAVDTVHDADLEQERAEAILRGLDGRFRDRFLSASDFCAGDWVASVTCAVSWAGCLMPAFRSVAMEWSEVEPALGGLVLRAAGHNAVRNENDSCRLGQKWNTAPPANLWGVFQETRTLRDEWNAKRELANPIALTATPAFKEAFPIENVSWQDPDVVEVVDAVRLESVPGRIWGADLPAGVMGRLSQSPPAGISAFLMAEGRSETEALRNATLDICAIADDAAHCNSAGCAAPAQLCCSGANCQGVSGWCSAHCKAVGEGRSECDACRQVQRCTAPTCNRKDLAPCEFFKSAEGRQCDSAVCGSHAYYWHAFGPKLPPIILCETHKSHMQIMENEGKILQQLIAATIFRRRNSATAGLQLPTLHTIRFALFHRIQNRAFSDMEAVRELIRTFPVDQYFASSDLRRQAARLLTEHEALQRIGMARFHQERRQALSFLDNLCDAARNLANNAAAVARNLTLSYFSSRVLTGAERVRKVVFVRTPNGIPDLVWKDLVRRASQIGIQLRREERENP